MKKIFYGLIVGILFFSINVYAKEIDDVWASFVQDDVLDMKAYKPESFDELKRDYYINERIRKQYPNEEYYGSLINCNESATTCVFELIVGDDNITEEVSVKWAETDETIVSKVAGYLNTLKDNAVDNKNERPNYYLSDLDWLYYVILGKGSDNELKYSTVINEIVNDPKVELSLQDRMGDIFEFNDYGGGLLFAYYDGIIVDMIDFGLGKNYVVYIPENIEDNNDAIIAFIKERINNNDVKIEAVSKRSEFKSEWSEDGTYDFSKLGDTSKMCEYYFKLSYNENSYLFVVIKDESKMIGTGETGEEVFKLTYDFNGGKRQGESEYVDESVAVGMDITKANFIDNFTVIPPEGMELDAIEINGTRSELGSEYLLNKDTTFKYLWKKVATNEPEEVVVENKDNKIKIVFTSEELPDDIEIKVKEIGNKDKEFEEIKNVLKTENFKAFDISLDSKTKGPITKLDNGKFKVTVFLGKEYVGKKIVAYYIKDDGSLEKYAVIVDSDGYGTFETPHFSTYIFALEEEVEKKTADESTKTDDTKEETSTNINGEKVPQTFDGIMYYVVLLIVSVIGLASIVIFRKRFN